MVGDGLYATPEPQTSCFQRWIPSGVQMNPPDINNNNNTVGARPGLHVFIHTHQVDEFAAFFGFLYFPLMSDWAGGKKPRGRWAVSRLSSSLYLCASSTYPGLSVCPASRKERLSASDPPARLGRCARLASCAPPAGRPGRSVAASRHKASIQSSASSFTRPPRRAGGQPARQEEAPRSLPNVIREVWDKGAVRCEHGCSLFVFFLNIDR